MSIFFASIELSTLLAILDKVLSLENLAGIANFSKFHFHRIFKAVVGENLNQFITRVRLERAAFLLIHNPKNSITEIAYYCGFSSPATFSRAFRDKFQLNASEWRKNSKKCKLNSNFQQSPGKHCKDIQKISMYLGYENRNPNWEIKNARK